MQDLEVSGAVRHIYMSLGGQRLMLKYIMHTSNHLFFFFSRYGMKSDYGREPLHPTPPRPGYGPSAIPQAPGGPNTSVPQQGSVMMVYGLDPDKSNADKLFNIFCLYGNVLRVSFKVLDVYIRLHVADCS